MIDYVYLITTYNRYDSLKNLLTNILKLNHTKKIIVVDDCSTDDRYQNIINFHEDVLYYKTEQNNGKVNYWKTVNLLYQKAKEVNFKYGITLPDDVELIENFELILEKYKGEKIIRLFTQISAGKNNWGYEHWVDCAFISDYSFFNKLNFTIDEIIIKDDYKISSGVGKQITVRLNNLNYKVLDIGSIVNHLGNNDSQMHPKLRLEEPLTGKEFSGDIIICGLATIESRKNNLEITVRSLINQVDKLYVYQNGYKETFDFLKHHKIEIISSLDTGIDMGDAGKFYTIDKHKNCYYLSCDDDIIYPSDYVKNILSNLKKYNNKVIVTHHGRKIKNNASSYYTNVEKGFRCLDEITDEQPIDFGGTGVMGMYVNLVKDLNFNYFKSPNMGDIWVGKYAKENKIPILILPHKKNWITTSMSMDDTNTIYRRYKSNHDTQNNVMIEANSNKKYKVVVLTCTWQRPEITEIFVNCLLSVQEKTKSIFEYVNIVIDSDNSNLNVFKDRTNDFTYHNFPNTPISNKWNYGVGLTKDIDFDYILFLGSDDIMDQNVMLEYHNKMKDGNDFIGIIDMYVFNYINNKLYYWSGYDEKTDRKGETIGLGRCLSKKTIEKLNYTPWALNINKGLDKTLNNNIKKIQDLKVSKIKLTDFNGFSCDIKGNVNITKLTDYNRLLIEVNNETINKLNFNIDKIKSLSVEYHEIIPETPFIIHETVKPTPKKELTQKQINYDKINSILSTNPKVINVIPQQEQKPQTNGLKLNSATLQQIQRPKKRFR
jgi:hypothetical protein